LCYGGVVRNPLKVDDSAVLAAWLFWEMFFEDDTSGREAQRSEGEEAGKREPPPRDK